MREIEKEELLKNLRSNNDQNSPIDMEAVDFVLLKLNEIRHEVRLKLKKYTHITKEKKVS
jgi:hypothetical protein